MLARRSVGSEVLQTVRRPLPFPKETNVASSCADYWFQVVMAVHANVAKPTPVREGARRALSRSSGQSRREHIVHPPSHSGMSFMSWKLVLE